MAEVVNDARPWARFPDGEGGPRFASNPRGSLYWYPRRVLLTHPHDGHTAADTCIKCMNAGTDA